MVGHYRFRTSLLGNPHSSGDDNHCLVSGCTAATITVLTLAPVTVTVENTNSVPQTGLRVYAYDNDTYRGYMATTDANGQATFTLPDNSGYRFRVDLNGQTYFSDVENHCSIPSCASATLTVPVFGTVTVTVQDSSSTPQSGQIVYAYNGETYTQIQRVTDNNGQVALTLPDGNYRFRVDRAGTQYFSGAENHCDVPTCTSASLSVPASLTADVSTTTIDYTYDALYRLTNANYDSGASFAYTYDAVGNRLTQEINGNGAMTYTYDVANRLTQVGGTEYTWDNNGNLLNDGTSTYAYDSANRLTSVSQNGNTSTFAYNGMGDRLRQTVNGVLTTYTLDLNAGLTQVLADGANTYLHGAGRLGEQQPGGWVYHLSDALGSVRQVVDASGAVTLAKSYQPYGSVLASAGSGATMYGFTGEQTDGGTGLTYLRARYYAGGMGRFLTADTWPGSFDKPLTLNKYNYVENNVVNLIDPSGLCSEPGWGDSTGLFTTANCNSLETDLARGTTTFTEHWYRQLASQMRKDGLEQAAANMEHYLDGSGAELQLPESFVQDAITVALPEISKSIDKLVKWYVQMHFANLLNCHPTQVGPHTYTGEKGFTPNYAGIALGWWQEQKDVAAALGSFRVDVELSGNLHKKTSLFWFENVDAAVEVHVIILDVYDWNKGASVYYPPYLTGNKILDDWAGNLATNGTAKGYIARGDYTYTANLNNIGGPGWFFDANNPPSGWLKTSCIGSQFDIDNEGPGTVDYCGKPMR